MGNNKKYDEWIYQVTAEMSALLDIKAPPKVQLFGVDVDARKELKEHDKLVNGTGVDRDHNHRLMGIAFPKENRIIIKQTGSPFPAIRMAGTRHTIAHELIHLRHPRLKHGEQFDKRTEALVEKWKKWKEEKKK